jgi:hypothetical protein
LNCVWLTPIIHKSLSLDASTEESSAGFQAAPGSNLSSAPTLRQIDKTALSEDPLQPLAPPRNTDLGLAPPPLPGGVNVPPSAEMNRGVMRHSSPTLRLSVPHQNPASSLPYVHLETDSPRFISSCTSISMLAHCNQNSLAPPCESLTQTQCGRAALRQAGIAHGSMRALAPSLPIENIPNRPSSDNFLRRLVRRTLSKSSLTTPVTPGSRSDASGGEIRTPRRSKPTRRSMVFTLIRPGTVPENESSPTPPKPSRWTLIQRYVAKPSAAAKAAGTGVAPRTRTRINPSVDSPTRSEGTFTSGRSSTLSFFGDPMTRTDPFARPGGLGATVSASSAPRPHRSNFGAGRLPHTGNCCIHTGDCRRSRGEGIDDIGIVNSRTPPPYTLHDRNGASSTNWVCSPARIEVKGRNRSGPSAMS